MTIEIEALDTLFFRDGKPFEKGDDVWATGIFPPLPSVLYGVLRSAYLAQQDIGLEEVEKATSGLIIKNIAYHVNLKNRDEEHKTERLQFPLPLDLVIEKEPEPSLAAAEKDEWKRNKSYYETEFNSFDGALMDENKTIKYSHLNQLPFVPQQILGYQKGGEVEGVEHGFIDQSLLEKYLSGESAIEIRKLSELYQFEPKIGISRSNATRTTSEGNLYRVGMIRTTDVRIVVEFEGLDLAPKGILKIGAENKLAVYSDLSESIAPKIDLDLDRNEFKIYLATPAFFEQGYYPSKIFEDHNIEAELLSCVVGKYINVGGFDMVKRAPKEMRKAVPAGSVYHYQLTGDLKPFFEYIKENGISEFGAKKGEGFGIAYLSNIESL
ncbi:MAG: type III-B CRISPR module-associated protein Cmr3 [Bacteroidota bacterium]